MRTIVSILIVALLIPTVGMAYTKKEAISTIVGEASGEGFTGMVLVAEAIRNRGSLKGCYGLHATHSHYETKHTWDLAADAWQLSESTHLTHGATGWGSTQDWKKLDFKRGKIITIVWNNHIFYKER